MEGRSEPCPQCREPLDVALKVCGRCGVSVLIEVRLHGPVSEPRARFALARQLAELGLPFSSLKSELEAPTPVLARGLSRAQAAKVGEVLAKAGVPFSLGASGPAAPAGGSSRSPALVAGLSLLAIIVIAGAVVTRRRQPAPAQLPSPPAPVVVAEVAEPTAVIDAGAVARARPTRSLDQVVKSVVSLRCAASMGAGFFVSPSELLTNAHVLCPPGDVMKVVTPAGLEGTGEVVRRDDKLDLAMVRVIGLVGEPLEVEDATSVKLGEPLSAVGSPRGLDFTVHNGTLAFMGRRRLSTGFMQVDMSISPGNSGGPVVNAAGEVVGVMSLVMTNANGIALALPINYALEGVRPVWSEAPQRLRSEAWRSLLARIAKESETTASEARVQLSKPGLIKVGWIDQSRILAAVISPEEEASARRLRFELRRADQVLCELFATKTYKWERARLDRLDARVREWIEENRVAENLYGGIMELQWSSCPAVFERSAGTLTVLLVDGADRLAEATLDRHPRGYVVHPEINSPVNYGDWGGLR